jgi:hypothetical protein
MSSSKKIDLQRDSAEVFIRVYRLEIQSVMLVFSTQLFELQYCPPSNLLSGSEALLPPPPPFPKSKYTVQTVCGWEGGGMLSPVGDHILQEFNTLYLTKFRTYKIATPP